MTTETDPGVSTILEANWYETFFDEHWLVISSQTHSQERSAAEAEFLIAELGLESSECSTCPAVTAATASSWPGGGCAWWAST